MLLAVPGSLPAPALCRRTQRGGPRCTPQHLCAVGDCSPSGPPNGDRERAGCPPAHAATRNVPAVEFGGGDEGGLREPLEVPVPGWSRVMGSPEPASGSCRILQQMPCNLQPDESHLPSPATCCPGLQLIYCALGCSQHKLQYSKSFCSILQGDRAQPQPPAAARQRRGAPAGMGRRG